LLDIKSLVPSEYQFRENLLRSKVISKILAEEWPISMKNDDIQKNRREYIYLDSPN